MDLFAPLDPPRTPAAAVRLRLQVRQHFFDHCGEDPLSQGATCDDCASVFECPVAFDPYSTGGDCLWEK